MTRTLLACHMTYLQDTNSQISSQQAMRCRSFKIIQYCRLEVWIGGKVGDGITGTIFVVMQRRNTRLICGVGKLGVFFGLVLAREGNFARAGSRIYLQLALIEGRSEGGRNNVKSAVISQENILEYIATL